jgi:hypothetical protein
MTYDRPAFQTVDFEVVAFDRLQMTVLDHGMMYLRWVVALDRRLHAFCKKCIIIKF